MDFATNHWPYLSPLFVLGTNWVTANNKPFLSTRYVIRNLTSGDKLHIRVISVKGDAVSDPAVLDHPVLVREILGMYLQCIKCSQTYALTSKLRKVTFKISLIFE